jgi:hypothetical protein
MEKKERGGVRYWGDVGRKENTSGTEKWYGWFARELTDY